MTSQTEFVHHRPAVGSPTACGFEARAMTTSTAWGMVTCVICLRNHARAEAAELREQLHAKEAELAVVSALAAGAVCTECEGYGDPDPDGCPRCGRRGFRG